MSRIASCLVALMMASTLVAAMAVAQTLTPTPSSAEAPPVVNDQPALTPTQPATRAPYPTTSATEMDAERAKIWNSPAMLRGRAWLHDYCARSAKVTPEQAQEYMTELQNMSPSQMKLWLLKFQEQEEMIHQQQAMFNAHRQAGVQQAVGVEKATQ